MDLALEVDSIEGLSEEVQGFYSKLDDGKYELKLTGGLKAKNTDLLGKLANYKRKEKEAQDAAEAKAIEDENKRINDLEKNKDYESLLETNKLKYERQIKELMDRGDNYKTIAIAANSGHDATRLASEIAITVNDASTVGHLEPQFARRLETIFVEGKAVVQVLGEDGKPNGQTLVELQNEIKSKPQNSMLVEGSKGSGAGFKPNSNSSNSGVDLSKLTAKQKLEYAREQQQ